MSRFIAFLAGLLGGAIALHAQAPAPQGVYATIDLLPMREFNRRLETPGQRRTAAREVLHNPAAHMPPVLYAVANVLSGDQPEEAIFWYHVGRVRAVYDAFRCKDNSARNVIPELGKTLSVELVRSQYYQREQLPGIAKKALDWDAENPRNYDQRWICLYGRVARSSPGADPAEVQKPESEWPGILQHIHEAHLKSVEDFAAQPAPTR
jgi:hypothetical protein